jgi:hypothetical protein
MRRTPHYEDADDTFTADAYTVSGWGRGIAWRVYGWETEPDQDSEWTGEEVRTGRIVVVMIGDDRRFVVDPEDVTPLADLDYCAECGQVGCTHDGRDREEVA